MEHKTPPATWLLGYVALIGYVSLYPATEWRMPVSPWWDAIALGAARTSRSDILSNVLAYVPLGSMLYWRLRAERRAFGAGLLAVFIGTLVSVLVEAAQLFLPARVPSLGDVATNAAGTSIGALATAFAMRMMRRRPGERPGQVPLAHAPTAGMVTIALWVLSQWSPFVPSLDWATLRDGVAPLRAVLRDPALLRWPDLAVYACNLLALGLIAATLRERARPLVVPLALGAGAVLAVKACIVGRGLSLEALGGLCAAAISLALLCRLRSRVRDIAAATALLSGFLVAELAPAQGGLHAFNWIPLAGAIENNLNAFADLLGAVWPFFGLGYLAARLTRPYMRREVMVLGGIAVFAFAFAAELAQQLIPGRHGDMTVAAAALTGWLASWRWRAAPAGLVGQHYSAAAARRPDRNCSRR
ncbi:MAG: VanZ family protein [Betaproteobacteria bacterium]